jgi:hypothetical protein
MMLSEYTRRMSMGLLRIDKEDNSMNIVQCFKTYKLTLLPVVTQFSSSVTWNTFCPPTVLAYTK